MCIYYLSCHSLLLLAESLQRNTQAKVFNKKEIYREQLLDQQSGKVEHKSWSTLSMLSCPRRGSEEEKPSKDTWEGSSQDP